jgi:HEAT repeat protein
MIALFAPALARADDIGSPQEIVRAIVEADVAGESLFRAQSKLARLDDAQKKEAAELLIEATESNLERPRVNAVHSLARLGATASSTAPRLIDILQDEKQDATLRALSAAALSKIGADPKTVVPVLAVALTDKDRTIREQSAKSLGDFASVDLTPVVADLVNAAKDPQPNVRLLIARALARAGGKDAVDPLIALLDDSELPVRLQAIASLGELRDTASPAVERLTSLLHESNVATLRAAAMALARIGEPASSALGAMLQADDRGDLRAACALLKYKTGQTALALSELKDAAPRASSDWSLAVSEIGAPAAPMLGQLLGSRRTAPIAIDALKQMGPSAKDAVPDLRRFEAACSDQSLRSQAQAAIQLIDQ